LEFGSDTMSSVTPATGSRGGDGLRLSMLVNRVGSYGVGGYSLERNKKKAAVMRLKSMHDVYEHMA
jgi:hypothetical protein